MLPNIEVMRKIANTSTGSLIKELREQTTTLPKEKPFYSDMINNDSFTENLNVLYDSRDWFEDTWWKPK